MTVPSFFFDYGSVFKFSILKGGKPWRSHTTKSFFPRLLLHAPRSLTETEALPLLQCVPACKVHKCKVNFSENFCPVRSTSKVNFHCTKTAELTSRIHCTATPTSCQILLHVKTRVEGTERDRIAAERNIIEPE